MLAEGRPELVEAGKLLADAQCFLSLASKLLVVAGSQYSKTFILNDVKSSGTVCMQK